MKCVFCDYTHGEEGMNWLWFILAGAAGGAAVPASVVTSFFALDPAPLVGRLYGGFLVAVALFGLVSGVAANLKKKG